MLRARQLVECGVSGGRRLLGGGGAWEGCLLLCARRQRQAVRRSVSSAARAKIDAAVAAKRVPQSIAARVGDELYMQRGHPLCIVKERIAHWFATEYDGGAFELVQQLDPVVSVTQNFDELLVPADHVSRSENDTYYLDEQHVLRCHTSAHQTSLLRAGQRRFLVAGDVYRCDTVDSTHFPVFHQMEAVRLFSPDELARLGDTPAAQTAAIEADMKRALAAMIRSLFGDVTTRWVDAYFPFTDPSAELEIFYRDEWLEVLGCGVMQQSIIDNADLPDHRGWAFGIGLERIAMALFRVPDIRLFWSRDERFMQQFRDHATKRDIVFAPYSKYPALWHDVSFWLPSTQDTFHVNKFHELVREVAGDLVEDVSLIDEFTHPKTNKTSNAFRINYRHMDRSLTNAEIDIVHKKVREESVAQLGVELR